MRGIISALLALAPAFAFALVLPEADQHAGLDERAHNPHNENLAVVDLNHPSYARLSLPFPEIYDNAFRFPSNDSLVFHLNVLDSLQRCGYGNITVNGYDLKQAGTNTSSQGRGLLPASSNGGSKDHILDAEWEFSCLADQPLGASPISADQARAQFLSFIIHKIDGQTIDGGSGFTASFRQHPDSHLLRIEPEVLPVPDSASTPDWLEPSSESPVAEVDDDDGTDRTLEMDSLDTEIAKLKRLKIEAEQLRVAIKKQERLVWKHVKEELKRQLKAAKEEIRNCESIRCAVHTAFDKMHASFKFIQMKFCPKHGTNSHYESRWQRFWNFAWSRSSPAMAVHRHSNVHRTQSAFSSSGSDHGLAHSILGASSHIDQEDHDSTKPQPQLRVQNQSRHYFARAAFIAAEIMALTLIPISLFIFMCRYCSRSRRAERQWQRESRRAARTINNARRRRTLWKWWRGLGRDPRITDYEEKRALVLEQEQVLECAMQRELRDLRAAADAVSSMVSGEDDRTPDRSSAAAPRRHQHTLTRRDSLPDYRSEVSYGEPPPVYEEDQNDAASLSGVVVDGFQYGNGLGAHYAPSLTPSTPRSSVFGCNSGPEYSSDEDEAGAKD